MKPLILTLAFIAVLMFALTMLKAKPTNDTVLAQLSFAGTFNANEMHNSYQQGYNQGVRDWNMFAQDLRHHFICPYNDTSGYCPGYDAALRFETSDQ
ncbi:MAG: hypothetical protein DLM72_17195 [Candidatus Nitrosopolaris wilkensis]|nr:MAG: hypothetical protein DLM72_17195 [Candidatus Nitrosopolaris wilkensis]